MKIHEFGENFEAVLGYRASLREVDLSQNGPIGAAVLRALRANPEPQLRALRLRSVGLGAAPHEAWRPSTISTISGEKRPYIILRYTTSVKRPCMQHREYQTP